MHKRIDTATSFLFAVSLFLFILTFSIALPIYFRPFYYAHIDTIELSQQSGFSKAEIRNAYDEVLDYLTLPGKEFSTGVMKHSAEGAAHFADCKRLFYLNTHILVTSLLIILILLLLKKKKIISEFRLGSHSSFFWASISAVTLPIIFGCLAAIDFDNAFVVFHNIFFPGKDNWIFNPSTDEIINVLPQKFFMHCAILIALSIIIFSTAGIVYDTVIKNADSTKS